MFLFDSFQVSWRHRLKISSGRAFLISESINAPSRLLTVILAARTMDRRRGFIRRKEVWEQILSFVLRGCGRGDRVWRRSSAIAIREVQAVWSWAENYV